MSCLKLIDSVKYVKGQRRNGDLTSASLKNKHLQSISLQENEMMISSQDGILQNIQHRFSQTGKPKTLPATSSLVASAPQISETKLVSLTDINLSFMFI